MRWTAAGCRPRRTCRRLYRRAESGDGAADDEGVHLARASLGVDGFGVGDEPSDIVLQQDSVTVEQFPRLSDGFAHPAIADVDPYAKQEISSPPALWNFGAPD